MTNTDTRARLTVFSAAILIYFAHRILGASKEYAWQQAQLITVNAIMDKTVELTGVNDPRKDETQ